MLERIGDLVRNLVVVIFVAALLEMLIPQGSFSRYLRLVTGLLVILLVVTFIGTLVNRLPEELSFAPVTAAAGEQDQAQGRQLWRLNQQKALNVYRSAVTKLIEEEILSRERWIPASISLRIEEDQTNPLFGSIYQAVIKITSAPEIAAPADRSIRIEPVKIGPSSQAGQESMSGHRVPELESALARRLQLPAELIEVWEVKQETGYQRPETGGPFGITGKQEAG